MATPTTREQITNPYTQENRAKYKMGSVETFLHDTLGFRTGYDKYNEQMDNAMKEWETQNQSLAYEEQYNSPEAQAERMRQAGLNPDLAPNQIEPGTAGEMTEPESVPESPNGIDIEAFQSSMEIASKIAGIALDAVTGTGALFSTMFNTITEGTKALQGLDEKEIGIGKQLREIANNSYGELENMIKDNALPGENEWRGKVLAGAGAYLAKMQGLTGRNRKKFERMYNGMINSKTAQIAEANKTGKLVEALAKPEVASPDAYTRIQMNLAKYGDIKWEIETIKAQEELKVLNSFPELFKGMTVSMMRQKISEAIKSGNEAEISRYDKAIKQLDKIDRETKQKQLEADREYIKNFRYNPVVGLWEYNQAMERTYGNKHNLFEQTFGFQK